MLKTNVYDMNGKQVGEVELSEAVFGIEPNESVVHDVVKNHLANCRSGRTAASSLPRSPAITATRSTRRSAVWL